MLRDPHRAAHRLVRGCPARDYRSNADGVTQVTPRDICAATDRQRRGENCVVGQQRRRLPSRRIRLENERLPVRLVFAQNGAVRSTDNG
jgi:hypothetical protein